jgi:hypothetical protein
MSRTFLSHDGSQINKLHFIVVAYARLSIYLWKNLMNTATPRRATSCSLLHRYPSALSCTLTLLSSLFCTEDAGKKSLPNVIMFSLLCSYETLCAFLSPYELSGHLFPSQNHFKHLSVLRPQPTPLVCLRPFLQLFILLPCKWRQHFPP